MTDQLKLLSLNFAVSVFKPNFTAMLLPAISIILPAYNSSRFIALTIDSLLQQSFTNFELLIINDGSTDDTEAIINGYTDERIIYLKNETNKGLVYTLNKGITEAKAEYIARMDADDIALPDRLKLQKQWLDTHADTAAVGCTIRFIDSNGKDVGSWKEDALNCSYSAIKKMIPKENCIAHPTIMLRKHIAEQYLYDPRQVHCEDYDLWLRLLADGLIIEKVPETLLLYRDHTASITGSHLRKVNPYFKQFKCKKIFLSKRLKAGKWGYFENQVLLTTLYDAVMGTGKQIKKAIKF